MVCNGTSVASAGGSACAGGTEGRGPCSRARSLRWARAESVAARAERAASRRGGGGAVGRMDSGRRDSAVRQAVARGVPAAAWCLRVCDGAMFWRAGGRRSGWWSLLIRQVRLWIRGRGGGGLGSGCGLDWYGTGRGSWRGRGGDFELVADSSLVLVGGGGSVGGGVGGELAGVGNGRLVLEMVGIRSGRGRCALVGHAGFGYEATVSGLGIGAVCRSGAVGRR